jgi:hypothetical protein
MELDEFKQTYQMFGSSFHRKSDEELHKILHKQVDTVVEKIKRNLMIEIVSTMLFLLFVLYVLVTFKGTYLKLLASVVFGFSLLFITYVFLLFRKIKAYYASSLSVTDNIKQLITIINRFIRLYFQITMAFVPAVCILVSITVIADEGNAFISVTASQTLVYSTVSTVWCILMYFFTRWYVKLLYGKHLQQLTR